MNQIDSSAVENSIHKKSYYKWLCERSGLEGPLARFLCDEDFVWGNPDDKNRAEDGLQLRQVYAEEVGADLDAQMKDKLWKSIHGKCSLFEVLFAMAEHIDAMVNDQDESMAPAFMKIMLDDLGMTFLDEEDCDFDFEKCVKVWKRCKMASLFPLKHSAFNPDERSLWQKLNDWVDENTDEDGYFVME